jgi:peptidoglycan hydrolase CwlO-like protein
METEDVILWALLLSLLGSLAANFFQYRLHTKATKPDSSELVELKAELTETQEHWDACKADVVRLQASLDVANESVSRANETAVSLQAKIDAKKPKAATKKRS